LTKAKQGITEKAARTPYSSHWQPIFFKTAVREKWLGMASGAVFLEQKTAVLLLS
jgi:hypothetical protein